MIDYSVAFIRVVVVILTVFALVAIYAFIRASQSVEQIIDSIIDKDKK